MLQYRTQAYLGAEKLPISRIGLGTWALGGGWGPQPEEQSLAVLQAALEQGCSLIDTAPLYGAGRAERFVAQVLKTSPSAHVTVLTKVHPLGYHWAPAPGTPIDSVFPPSHIIAQAEESLRRLQVDCLDCLLLQTWCPTWGHELAWYETMLRLKEQGKIRTWGISASDHRPDEMIDVIVAGRVDIVEVAYSVFDQRANEQLFPSALQHQVSIIARSPLASGALAEAWTEKQRFAPNDWRRRVFRDETLLRTVRRVHMLKEIVGTDLSLSQIALRFCLSNPAVTTIIPGAQTVEHVHCNFAVVEQGSLPQSTLDQIATLWHQEFQYHIRTSVGEEGEGEKRKKPM
jgi:aryl-alcohol dehydrogenase-like predicted oxidoreductase